MTPEEVIVLAARHHVASESPLFNQQLVAFAAAIEAATIERCAKVCDDWRRGHMLDACCDASQHAALTDAAKRIRALAKKEG